MATNFSRGFAISVISTIKNANRYRQLLSIAVKYGFKDFFEESKLHLLSSKGKEILAESADAKQGSLSRAARVRCALEELGPTFIKLGQILSTRPDILPADWIQEFQKLQSDVPPHAAWRIR